MGTGPDCEEGKGLKQDEYKPVPTHQGRKVLPNEPTPAQAWTENEELRSGTDSTTNSPGENKRLLANSRVVPKQSSGRIQAGLTLGVWGTTKTNYKCPPTPKFDKAKTKTSFQKKKEQIAKLLKPPYFMISLIIVMTLVHVFSSQQFRSLLEWSPGEWWRQPWRLLTYGFLHAGTAHLTLNAVVGLTVGWALEREQSWRRVACVWAGGVAAGALGAGALQPHVRVVGASAAVYALLTSHIANVTLRFGHIPLWWFRPLSVLVLVLSEGCWAVVQACSAAEPALGVTHAGHSGPFGHAGHAVHAGHVGHATHATLAEDINDHVAWSAHVVGALAGVPLAFLIYTGEHRDKRYIWVCRIISIAFLLAGIVLATVCYSLFDVA